jgi:transcriptional regulator with XRE-family HTH domain
MHELIGRGVAEARHREGLTQEELARRLQGRGLRTWRTSTVGSLEAGLRKPRLDEVLLMADALNVAVDKLIPGRDQELVDLGEGAVVDRRWIREMLRGEFPRDPNRPRSEVPYHRFPVMDVMSQAMDRVEAEQKRYRALTVAILGWAEQHDIVITDGDWKAMFGRPSDTERHVARRLGREVPPVKLSARVLWDHRDFDEERDRRVGDIDVLEPRSRQARRGLVTREMLAELRAFLDETDAGQEGDGDGER